MRCAGAARIRDSISSSDVAVTPFQAGEVEFRNTLFHRCLHPGPGEETARVHSVKHLVAPISYCRQSNASHEVAICVTSGRHRDPGDPFASRWLEQPVPSRVRSCPGRERSQTGTVPVVNQSMIPSSHGRSAYASLPTSTASERHPASMKHQRGISQNQLRCRLTGLTRRINARATSTAGVPFAEARNVEPEGTRGGPFGSRSGARRSEAHSSRVCQAPITVNIRVFRYRHRGFNAMIRSRICWPRCSQRALLLDLPPHATTASKP